MEEAAESQQKICMIHYRQMEKADRDAGQAIRAEDECRQMIVQFPNSKFVPETKQLLRNIQEALADGEFKVGAFYLKRGDNPAAVNRFGHVVDQYPLYSKADEALWDMGDGYSKLGPRFRKQEGEAYARMVKEYPLSDFADAAKKKLKDMELPIPEADTAALARMKWEQENRQKPGIVSRGTGFLRRGPDVSDAARSGDPAMTTLQPPIPPSVPQPGAANAGFSGDVTATTVSGSFGARHQSRRARQSAQPDAKAATGCTQQPQASFERSESRARRRKKKRSRSSPLPIRRPQPPRPLSPTTSLMSRILLADDSPHAQRMGERILREEGFEVVSLTSGETALARLPKSIRT